MLNTSFQVPIETDSFVNWKYKQKSVSLVQSFPDKKKSINCSGKQKYKQLPVSHILFTLISVKVAEVG